MNTAGLERYVLARNIESGEYYAVKFIGDDKGSPISGKVWFYGPLPHTKVYQEKLSKFSYGRQKPIDWAEWIVEWEEGKKRKPVEVWLERDRKVPYSTGSTLYRDRVQALMVEFLDTNGFDYEIRGMAPYSYIRYKGSFRKEVGLMKAAYDYARERLAPDAT